MDLIGTRWREMRTGLLVEITAVDSDGVFRARTTTGKKRSLHPDELLRRYIACGQTVTPR